MIKRLKFANPLPNLILDGEKDTTWRVNDDKDLSLGDNLSLISIDENIEFARAKIIFVKNITFGELVESDWEGHERFGSDSKMYETYSKYYSFQIIPNTKLKRTSKNFVFNQSSLNGHIERAKI